MVPTLFFKPDFFFFITIKKPLRYSQLFSQACKNENYALSNLFEKKIINYRKHNKDVRTRMRNTFYEIDG